MSFLLKDTFHTTLAETVYGDIITGRSNYYYFIGQILPWANEYTPSTPVTTDMYEYDTRNSILSVKKVNPTDVSLVVPRRDWTLNTVYDQYDGNYSVDFPAQSGATSIKEATFYVMTGTYGVYKCLDNSNDGPSLYEPTGSDYTPETYLDGYVWKYLYTIPPSLRNRFLTDDYLPVQSAIYQQFYSSGQIDTVIIDNPGSGYLGNAAVTLTVIGSALPFSNTVGSVSISNAGNGYQRLANTTAITANTTGVFTTTGAVQPTVNATATLTFTSNALSAITITNYGAGYSPESNTIAVFANTTFVIATTGNSQPTTNATGTVIVSYTEAGDILASNTAVLRPVLNETGSFIDVIIDNKGRNYSNAAIVITDSRYQGTSLYKGVSNVIITTPGAGYTSAVIANTTSNIFVSSSATQPTSNAKVSLRFASNVLVGIDVISKGSGYTANTISNLTFAIVTTGNSQPTVNATASIYFANAAVLTPVITGNSTHKGYIDRIIIEDPGTAYSANNQTFISVLGDGTGAALTPFVNQSGQIENIVIENKGTGYTYTNLIFTGDGAGANAYVDLSVGDVTSEQGSVQLAAINGAIYGLRVHAGGDGYTTATIVLDGDGSEFIGSANIVGNSIVSVDILNPGYGYNYANVIVLGPAGSGNANISAIISPYNGHGYDPVNELFADSLMLFSTINNEKNQGIAITNDFRQFGLIKNIHQYDNPKHFSNINGSGCYLITLDTLGTLESDTVLEFYIQNEFITVTKKFEIAQTVPGTNQALILSKDSHVPMEDDIFTDPLTDTDYTVVSIDKVPSINKFSGELLYIDNRTSVSYSEDQLIKFRTIIEL